MRHLRILIATLAGVPTVLVSAAALGQQRHCEASRAPDPLPTAMQLVDSMALATSLPARRFAATTFSLWYTANGHLTHVLALTDSLVASGGAPADSEVLTRARLGTLIAGAAFPQDSAQEMTVRLTVARDSAGAVTLSTAPSVRCDPMLRPHFHPPNDRRSATAEEVDEIQHATPALVTFVVDTAGHPLEVLIERSSGSRLIDSWVVENITGSPYRPGTVDGFVKMLSVRLNVLPPIPLPRHGP